MTAALAAMTPLAAAEEELQVDWRCTDAADASALALDIATNTYYQRVRESGGYTIVELWQEANGIDGLQYSAGMACTGKADKMLSRVCAGLCPLTV